MDFRSRYLIIKPLSWICSVDLNLLLYLLSLNEYYRLLNNLWFLKRWDARYLELHLVYCSLPIWMLWKYGLDFDLVSANISIIVRVYRYFLILLV